MKTWRAVAVAGAAAIALAGCGGSSNKQLSYSDFVAKADAICAAGQQEAEKASSLAGAAAAAEKALAKFKDLKPPDQLKAAYDRFVSISERQIAAAKKGDQAAANALNGPSNEAASQLGAQACIS